MLSEIIYKEASKYFEENPPKKELTAIHLGRLRLAIKRHLSEEMKEIDKMVKNVVGEVNYFQKECICQHLKI